MKATFQTLRSPIEIGIKNALEHYRWDTQIGLNGDLVFISDPAQISFKSLKELKKNSRQFIINNEKIPEILQNKNCSILDMSDLTDTLRYKAGPAKPEFKSTYCYVSNFQSTITNMTYLRDFKPPSNQKDSNFKIAGNIIVNSRHYIGTIENDNIISFCKSAEICLDFGDIYKELLYNECDVFLNGQTMLYWTDNKDKISEQDNYLVKMKEILE